MKKLIFLTVLLIEVSNHCAARYYVYRGKRRQQDSFLISNDMLFF